MVFFSLDTILARRFFPAEVVGLYSAVSNLGKVIFLGTWGISRAMFPLASEKHDEKKDASPLLEQAFLVVLLISVAALAVYFILPKQIISILYGNQYSIASEILIYPSIAMSILALTNIFILYNLCVNKPKRNYLTILFTALQIVLLSLFHASLLQFMLMLILSNILFFLGMFIISFKEQFLNVKIPWIHDPHKS
jgi:O-antigen/teichoic acid export membrane protein